MHTVYSSCVLFNVCVYSWHPEAECAIGTTSIGQQRIKIADGLAAWLASPSTTEMLEYTCDRGKLLLTYVTDPAPGDDDDDNNIVDNDDFWHGLLVSGVWQGSQQPIYHLFWGVSYHVCSY